MENEHQIEPEALAILQFGIEQHHHWIVYNTIPYHLSKEDIHCFRKRDEAEEFCDNNISEFDNYVAFSADTFEDVMQTITSGEILFNTEGRKERNREDMDDLDMGRGKGNRL